MRELYRIYRENRSEFDRFMREMAGQRRQNYPTKGTYH